MLAAFQEMYQLAIDPKTKEIPRCVIAPPIPGL
jgi:hypothetical protein